MKLATPVDSYIVFVEKESIKFLDGKGERDVGKNDPFLTKIREKTRRGVLNNNPEDVTCV